MVKAFPLLDSLVISVAVVALGANVAAYRGWGTTGYGILAGAAACLGVLVYRIGRRRGTGNVDGVFLGPLLRVSTLMVIIVSFGGWWFAPASMVQQPGVEISEISMKEQEQTFCTDRLKNLTDLLDAIERSGELTIGGKDLIAELQNKLGLSCEGTEFDKAYARSQKIIENFSKASTNIEDQNAQRLAAAISPNIIPPAPNDQSAPPPAPAITFGPPERPVTGGVPRIPVNISIPGKPDETIIVRQEPHFLLKVLGFLLFPITSIFGIDLTAAEIQTAVFRAASEQSGEPIRELLTNKQLSPAARNAVIELIGSAVVVNQRADSRWGKGWQYYLETDVPRALCLLALQKTGQTQRSLDIILPDENTLMNKFLTMQDRNAAATEIEECIREKEQKENGPGMTYFHKLRTKNEQG